MKPSRIGTASSSARPLHEVPSTSNASTAQQTPATLSLGVLEGLQAPGRSVPPATTGGAPRRATLPGTTDAKRPELLRDLWQNIAVRLDAPSALALSSADMTLHEATGGIAVAKAIVDSGHVRAAVLAGLRKAAAMADADAHTRRDMLRSIADKIGQSTEPPAMLVHAFMRHIDALRPADRADARAALEASLAQMGEQHQAQAFSVVKHSDALKGIDTLPDHERTVRVAALAEDISSIPTMPVRLAMLGNLIDKVGQLPGEHRAEGLTAVVAQLAALPEQAAQEAQPLVHDLLALAQALPIDQLGTVPLQLAQKMGAASEPSEAFDRTWNHAMRLAEAATTEQVEQMATLLADQIPSLTPEARQEAFDCTIALIGKLPPSEQSLNVLQCLAKTVHFLPEFAPEVEGRPGRAAVLHKIMESIAGVEHRHRAYVLNACAAAIEHVTHEREQLFDDTLEEIRTLSGDLRSRALKTLIKATKPTVNDAQGNEWSKILQSLDGLRGDDRDSVVLTAAWALSNIEQPGLLPLLILDQMAGAHPRHQLMALQAIFRDVRWSVMASEDLARNADAALSALSELPADWSAEAARLAALMLPIDTTATGEKAAVFTKLLMQAERTPDGQLLEQLAKRMRDSHDPVLQRQGFAPLLRLAGEPHRVAFGAVRYLADQLATVPDAELQSAWDATRSLVDRELADGTPLAAYLDQVTTGLAKNLSRLDSQSKGEALAWLQQSIPRLFENKTNLGSESMTLLKLASAIRALPEDLRLSAFDSALTHVADVLAADRRADPGRLINHDGGGEQGRRMHPDERGAALLAQLAQAAGSLPKLAPRAAVSQILTGLQSIGDDASRANVLKSLVRDALPAALERPVKFGMRASDPLKRHVSREVLLQGFVKEVERLSPEARVAALQQMLEGARAATHTNGESARPKDDKSAKLPALLQGMLQKAEAALRA